MTCRQLIPCLLGLAVFCRPALSSQPESTPGYSWNLPKGFPKPPVPADNPMTEAKVELGRYLFYDTRLSVNGKSSCATCHQQELAFTDGRARSIGSTGESHSRSAMSLVNVAYSGSLTWSNPQLMALEKQALVPMFGLHPVELGLRSVDGSLRYCVPIRGIESFFERAFPASPDPFAWKNVTQALACFERSIISARSPYDRYHYSGADDAVSDSAKRGEILFFSQPLSCFRCHGGLNFSDATVSASTIGRAIEFHNTGLPDIGRFKAPTLRNIAITAPYMHDGSIATLEGVLDHYAAGGGNNPNKDPLIAGFSLSAKERADLIAFLESLTDEAVRHDARFANPW